MHHHQAVLLFLLFTASTHCLAATGIEDMRSNDSVQGLYEIREKAREFVARENAGSGDKWEVGEPNLKVFVPRCVAPLKARWDTIRWSSVTKGGELVQRSRRVIAVSCTRTVGRAQSAGKWDVHVPVVPATTSPAHRSGR